jgi:Na+/H+-dicarboxylate symporter
MNLTKRILIAMAAAIVLGLLINWSASEGSAFHQFVNDYLIGGLFLIVGKAFVAGLKVMVVPLVFVSLVCGTASLNETSRLGRYSVKTIGLYLGTTAIAIILAISAALLIQPGAGIEKVTDLTFQGKEATPFAQVIIDMFPTNPVQAMADGKMLQIILFAILLGFSISHSGEPGKRVAATFNDWNEVVLKLVAVIMHFAPYGVFALLFNTVAKEGFREIQALAAYFFTVIGVLLVHAFLVYPALLSFLAGLKPSTFLRKVRGVQTFAFSTASSGATIPVTLRTAEERIGVKNSLASFTVPLGATINMDGTAIMQGVATIFIAQMYGVDLGLMGILTVIATATLASVGTAGVPSAGLVMLSMVLTQVNLPVEAIALIMGVDRLLDMTRTAVNVTGDLAVTTVVAKWEGVLDETVYQDPNAGELEATASPDTHIQKG